ncbi:DUF1146 domain-containing protein [Facklamia sp. DSM 111018]|uniref:DUF1146 domain-containing protein n=1 Tax=Facklamia lactis TaxID=2749967 RepID=A0ABS0LNR4_9LACT|nr:DUF1146 family protein [Facklamia lactis]MBG9979631.1 DUF1146 domain-containing protein [Facklamia lactis]MBG9985689.1 DUF1146 domain-containing protein [Facklamia lactis]
MLAIVNGMAVLMIHILFVTVAYFTLSKVNWRKFLHPNHQTMDRMLCLILSISVGYMTSSFFITIIEILQQILYAIFL